MTATILPTAKTTFFDSNGRPLAGGSVYFYIPNTSTFKNTWQDEGKTILNTNPVVLDSSGQAIIYGDGQYRQVVYDVHGNLIWDRLTDSYALNSEFQSFVSSIQGTSGPTQILFLQVGIGAVVRTLQAKLQERISVLDFGADPTGTNDSTLSINAAIASMPSVGGRIEFPQAGVFKISGPILGKTNIVLEGCGAGRDTLWTRVTLLSTNAAAYLDFRDCDHYTIKGIRFDGANLSSTGLKQGYTAGSVHVAHARIEDFVVQRVTGTAIDTGSSNPGGATNDCTYKDVIIEIAGLGYDWYSTNNLVFGGTVAGCTNGGSQHNTSSEVKFYGTVFSGNKADHVLAGDDFVNGFSCFGTWYETSTDGIIKRYHVPTVANFVGKILFSGCNLATSGPALFDLTNCQARVTIIGSRRDAGSASNIVAPAGNSILAVELLDDVTISGGGVLSKINVDGFSCDLASIFGDNLASRALPGNATTTGAAIMGWNRSNGDGEMNLIGAKGGGVLGGVSLGDWDGMTFKHLLWAMRSGTVFVVNTTSVPAGNPVGGGYLYVEAGALKFKGSSGTTTTIASA